MMDGLRNTLKNEKKQVKKNWKEVILRERVLPIFSIWVFKFIIGLSPRSWNVGINFFEYSKAVSINVFPLYILIEIKGKK